MKTQADPVQLILMTIGLEPSLPFQHHHRTPGLIAQTAGPEHFLSSGPSSSNHARLFCARLRLLGLTSSSSSSSYSSHSQAQLSDTVS